MKNAEKHRMYRATSTFSLVVLFVSACSGSDFSGVTGNTKDDNAKTVKGDANRKPGDNSSGGIDSISGDPSAEKTKIVMNSDTVDPIIQEDDCIQLPTGSDAGASKVSGSLVKNTVFHRSVAVDPGNTKKDPAPGFPGYKPYTISSPSEMGSTVFALNQSTLKSMMRDKVKEIEYFVFAHQFNQGLDKITIKLHTDAKDLSDVSSTNIYSAYGYLSVKNLSEKDGKIVGDVDIFSFNYDPNGSGPLHDKLAAIPSPQDGTDIVGPASEATTPKVSQKGVVLDGFKVTIEIGADLYDSVQYRAIRANLWTDAPLEKINLCK